MTESIVIVSAARTPIGGFQGELSALTAPSLGGVAIGAAIRRAGLAAKRIDEVNIGCVLPAGLGQAPARQASFAAGLGPETPCTTVNKMCGSGMKALMISHDALTAGSVDVSVCGGMESMSNAPYLLPKARGGYRLGHGSLQDHLFLDGLEDAYEPGRLMGTFAEDCASEFGFTREQQDAYAIESLNRANRAIEMGWFADEITPVNVQSRKAERTVEHDEQPRRARIDNIPNLKPAFRPDGTVTAANSSSISDGAAALVLTRASVAEKLGLPPLASVCAHSTHAERPARFPVAPIGAIQKLLQKLDWPLSEVDLYEINEAFAVVSMAAMRQLDLPADKVNVHGGACALGHPIGASGARILVTLIHALKRLGLRRGVASLCIGGGEATAVAIELHD